MYKQNRFLLLVLVCLLVGVGTVSANAGTPDLNVEFNGQNSPYVYSPYTYSVKVQNIGNSDANNVKVVIDLPLTDTSPTRHILGKLSGVDSNCQVVSNKLNCSLGKIRKRKNGTVQFNFEFPVSTKALTMTAKASTTSGDSNPANDEDTKTPNFNYPSITLTSANILNSHCTGQNLSSYFECELFPSSIQTHSVIFNSNGTISFSQPGYSGSWYQPSPKELSFSYSDGTNTVAEFNGYAVSATCFEGITTFPQSLNYLSPYKVCIQ